MMAYTKFSFCLLFDIVISDALQLNCYTLNKQERRQKHKDKTLLKKQGQTHLYLRSKI